VHLLDGIKISGLWRWVHGRNWSPITRHSHTTCIIIVDAHVKLGSIIVVLCSTTPSITGIWPSARNSMERCCTTTHAVGFNPINFYTPRVLVLISSIAVILVLHKPFGSQPAGRNRIHIGDCTRFGITDINIVLHITTV
jgi:hypothetical protein